MCGRDQSWVYLGRLDSRLPIPILDLLDNDGRSILTITVEIDGRVSLESTGAPKVMFEEVTLSMNRWILVGVVGKRAKIGAGDAGEPQRERPSLSIWSH